MAVKAFRAVDAAGLARVDFFVSRNDHTVYLNEINTMPGFTPISMYPKLWEASGIGYEALGLWSEAIFEAMPELVRLDLRSFAASL